MSNYLTLLKICNIYMYIHETQPYKTEVTVQQDCDDGN